MALTTLKIKIDRQMPDLTRDALIGQLELISALTRKETIEAIELNEAAASGLSDLTGAIANALRDLESVEEERRSRDLDARQQGIAHLRRLGLAPAEPMDLAGIIAAFGAYVDGLPGHSDPDIEQQGEADRAALLARLLDKGAEADGRAGAPRLTEPAPRAARRRAG